jgi:small glutamine-rich tetratricopeptide repeat-containing protein alpha
MDVQGLNIGILRYLEKLKETKVGDEDAKESLEVAIQCLCEVFHIDQDSFEGTSEPDLTVLYDEYQKRASDLRDGDRKRKSESLKSQGNIELKNGNLQSALDLYTQAIYTDGDNAVFYCNR